jgi:hypothetical protein
MSGDEGRAPNRRGSGFLAAAVDWICKCVPPIPAPCCWLLPGEAQCAVTGEEWGSHIWRSLPLRSHLTAPGRTAAWLHAQLHCATRLTSWEQPQEWSTAPRRA